MEVVQRTDDGPFGRRDVEEWSRLDELTGMLEHARVQTDRWAGVDALGGSHKYGKKIVDATKTGGAGQHRQRQQLEVFQSRVPGGALQVIRTQTASSWSHQGPARPNTTVSSSSTSSRTRWSSRSTAGGSTTHESCSSPPEPIAENFANLELALNPIDVSSLKMKACVGRSGSIGGRRPPSTRSRRLSASSAVNEEDIEIEQQDEDESPSSSAHHLQDLSRLCLQAHEEQERRYNLNDEEELQIGLSLGRRFSKSSSTDDIPAEIVARDEHDEGMSSWRRGARVRRSLQFSSRDGDRASGVCVPVPATKRHSFVTVESLKEVRGRLRHLTSDQVERSGKRNGVLKIPDYRRMESEEHDDGIASEETAAESDSPVNTMRGAKTTNIAPKTGSLETRSSRVSSAARTDEWFNRRKSYGFEQVHNQSSERGGGITEGNKTDSADSGISRSTETVPINTAWNESSRSSTCNEDNEDQGRKKTIITLNAITSPASKWSEKNLTDLSPTRRRFSESSAFFRSVTSEAQVAARRASAAPKPTTITIPIVFQQQQDDGERKKFSLRQLPDTSRLFTNGHTTPPPPDPETLGWASRRQLDGLGPAKRRSWAGDSTLLSQDMHNYNSDCDDKLIKTNKTHSIYSQEITNGGAGDIDMDDALSNAITQKKTKRVEFCKTEVHFAAESGRFHIIETDEKPPPSNNFRRRRRSQPSTSTANNTTMSSSTVPVVAQKPPLPELRFGDSVYEKKMLMTSSTNSNSNNVSNASPSESTEVTVPIEIEVEDNVEKGEEEHFYAAPNTTIISDELSSEDSGRNTDSDDNRPRGILKRLEEIETNTEQEESKWGVRLRPVQSSLTASPVSTATTPMWRSTVTLRNQLASEESTNLSGQMELQKLLRSLRPAVSPQRRSLDLSTDHPAPETWSVAERIKLAEERKNRGFSTKVNLGGAGETTVLQHNSEPTSWLPLSDEKSTKSENVTETGGQMNNNSRPLVVRIGNNLKTREENTFSSLTNGYSSLGMDSVMINKNKSINIDRGGNSSPRYGPEAVRRVSTGVLKSPSLIMQMQTLSCHSFSPARVQDIEEEEPHPTPRAPLPELGVPGQLAALRQLYEAAGEDDDSDAADREVSALMSPEDPNPPPRRAKQMSPCGGSVVSGSWSKMRAVRLSQQFHKYQPPAAGDAVKEQSGFVRLKPTSESTSPLIRPVPRTRRRAAAVQHSMHQDEGVTTNKSCTVKEDVVQSVSSKQGPPFSEPPQVSPNTTTVQLSAATFNMPSYGPGQNLLRAMDALVNTRNGAPRITSISLRYEGDPESPAAASSPATKSVTAISAARRVSSPAGEWASSSKPNGTRRSLSPNSARPLASFSTRLSVSPMKQESTTTENRFSPARTSLQARSSLSPSKPSGLPPRGSSPLRRPASPARSPQVRGPITAPTRRVSSPTPKKSTPQQTYFGAEVLEVVPRPEDRRSEDELVPNRTVIEPNDTQRDVRRTSALSYRSSSRGRLPEYTASESSKTHVDTSDSSRARSLSPVKRLSSLVTGEASPIYQNQAAISASKISPPPESPAKSSTALIEELTRAADEILQAVNGYSDDSAASSDDDKPAPRLSAVREGEVSRNEERSPRKKTTAAPHRLKKKVGGPTSSTSSVESVSKETRIHQRPALPCIRAQRPAVPLPVPGSPGQLPSSSDEGGNARKQRAARRRPAVPSSPKAERPSKEEEEALKIRERTEARAERLRSSRSRRARVTSTRHVEETVAAPCSKRVLAPDLSKLRAPVERIIPAAPRKSPVKSRKEEHHQLTRTANGATAERRLLLIEAGAASSARICGGTSNTTSALGGRVKPRGDPPKVTAK